MKQSDQVEFVALITEVLAFYKQDVSSFALQVWLQACSRYDLNQVRKALTQHAMDAEHGVFPPKPADLVRKLEGTATDRAAMAWGQVLEAMSRVGSYTNVVFDDPATHAAIEDLGGWVKMCRGEIKDLGYLQHRFCESHKAYSNRGDFEYPRMLCGDCGSDADYARRGLKAPPPKFIGNREKAMQVYKGGKVGGKLQISFDAGALADSGVKMIVNNR